MKFFCILFLGYWNLPAISAHAGSVDLGTYYPAPFGNYDRLKLAPRTDPGSPCDPGTIYVDDTLVTLQFCSESGTWAPGLWTKSGSNLYPANNSVNVGIGTSTPTALLHVLRSPTGADGEELIVEDLYGSGAFPAFHGTNRKWAIGATNPTSSAGDEKFGFIDRSGGPDVYRAVIDNAGKIGIESTTPEFRLTLDKGATTPDGGILAIGGTLGTGTTLATTGAGTRLIWYPRRAAFRAGSATATEWDDTIANPNIGNYSVAMGNLVTASGIYSTAMGNVAVASGNSSTAMGFAVTATGQNTIALGTQSQAGSSNSISIGWVAIATGNYTTAMGRLTTAQARGSMVVGQSNIASGDLVNWSLTDPLFVIGNGNGISGNPNQYANALTVLKNGNVGIGTTNPGTNRLEVTGGNIKACDGLIMQTGTTSPGTPASGQVWLCTDTGDATPCNGI